LIVVDLEGDDRAQVAQGVGQLVHLVRGQIHDPDVTPATYLQRERVYRIHRAVEVVQAIELLDVRRDTPDIIAIDPQFCEIDEIPNDFRLLQIIHTLVSHICIVICFYERCNINWNIL